MQIFPEIILILYISQSRGRKVTACVQIFPELILILYISQSRERQVADMIIRRGDHYRSYDSGNYFHERIDDYWSMEILLSKRG